jgi:hypothetical protein
MRGYSATDIFSQRSQRLLEEATSLVEAVPQRKTVIRCHELARAVWAVLRREYRGLRVVDGKYGSVEHSWLALRNYGDLVPGHHVYLDVYAVGRLPQVQLVALDWATHHGDQYKVGKERDDIQHVIVDDLVLRMGEAREFVRLYSETEI